MLLAIWNWFWVPFDSAFSPSFAETLEMELLNAFIDILYLFDILINFRTSFTNSKTGEEIFDLKQIAINYLKARFWIDLISSIPFNILTLIIIQENLNSVFFKMFSLFKLMRVLRLSRIVMYMNLKDNAKMSLKLVKLLFFIIMYLHWQGWAWYMIVKVNETWIPPLDYVYIVTNLYDDTVSMKYFTSLYHSTLLLAGGDIGPRREVQLTFCIVALIVWAIINANIFGNLAVLISSMNRKSSLFQDKIDTVNTAMKNMKLPEKTQKKVVDYIVSTQSTLDNQQEMDSFLKMISPSLRLEVTSYIFSLIVCKNPLFADNVDLVEYIVKHLTTLLFLPEDEVIRQGDASDHLYFLARGELTVFVTDKYKESKYVKTLQIGSYFGEIGIIKNWRRTATVKSKNYTTWATLKQNSYYEFKNRYPDIIRKMSDGIYSYQDRWKKFVKGLLSNISFLSHNISEVILEDLLYELVTDRIEVGSYLFK